MRFFFRFLLTALLLTLASRARAQGVGSIAGTPSATNAAVFAQHPQNIPISSINFNDCINDQGINFTVSMTGTSFVSYQLEVWAGTQDCTPYTSRSGTNPVCWPVRAAIANPALSTNLTIMERDIVSQLTATTKTVDTFVKAGPEVCTTAQTSSTATQVSLYFILTQQDHTATGNAVQYQTTVDLLGSAVNGTISAEVGQNLLFVNIPVSNGTTSVIDPDIKRWYVYCDPPPNGGDSGGLDAAAIQSAVCEAGVTSSEDASDGSDGATAAVTRLDDTDASDDASGSTDAGTTVTSTNGCGASSCPSQFILPGGGTVTSNGDEAGTTTTTGGIQVVTPTVFKCAEGDVTSTRIKITGLQNGVQYTVGVAALDSVGNIGPISNVVCDNSTTPTLINDFWDTYTDDNGKAGGGFCALEGVGMPAGSAAFSAGLLAAAVALVRRRRR